MKKQEMSRKKREREKTPALSERKEIREKYCLYLEAINNRGLGKKDRSDVPSHSSKIRIYELDSKSNQIKSQSNIWTIHPLAEFTLKPINYGLAREGMKRNYHPLPSPNPRASFEITQNSNSPSIYLSSFLSPFLSFLPFIHIPHTSTS